MFTLSGLSFGNWGLCFLHSFMRYRRSLVVGVLVRVLSTGLWFPCRSSAWVNIKFIYSSFYPSFFAFVHRWPSDQRSRKTLSIVFLPSDYPNPIFMGIGWSLDMCRPMVTGFSSFFLRAGTTWRDVLTRASRPPGGFFGCGKCWCGLFPYGFIFSLDEPLCHFVQPCRRVGMITSRVAGVLFGYLFIGIFPFVIHLMMWLTIVSASRSFTPRC